MPSVWHRFQDGFDRLLPLRSTHTHLQTLSRHAPPLARFDEPAALAAWLHDPKPERDDKNQVLRALIRANRDSPDDRTAALIWAGLWPGLDALYRRLLRFFPGEADDLAAAIAARFTHELRRADPDKLGSPAGTLLMNVERDIRRASMNRQNRARHLVPLDKAPEPAAPADTQAEFRLVAGKLASWLDKTDAALLVSVLLLDRTHKEAGAPFGLGSEAVRKRCRRALDNISKKMAEPVSAFSAGDGFSLVTFHPSKGGQDGSTH